MACMLVILRLPLGMLTPVLDMITWRFEIIRQCLDKSALRLFVCFILHDNMDILPNKTSFRQVLIKGWQANTTIVHRRFWGNIK
jgi:hypothetical protein